MTKISVQIIDDHQLIIDGLMTMLGGIEDIEVIDSARNGKEALAMIEKQEADVVLLDINLPDTNGLDLCQEIRKKGVESKILALTMVRELSLIKIMLRNGANGYLLKNSSQQSVVEAIRKAYTGEQVFSQDVQQIMLDDLVGKKSQPKSLFPKLSRREKEIVQLILDEKTTQEIADQLFIGFGTVETHRRNIMNKLGARNTAGMVRTVLEYGLLE